MARMTMVDANEARARVLDPGGPLLVLGAAGSGKTSLLIEAVAARLGGERGRPALALCLTRQAASQVRDEVIAVSGRSSLQPTVMTLHSFCLTVWSRYGAVGGELPRLLTAPEQEFRLRELLAGRGASVWPEGLGEASGTRSFARQVRAALARARQLGLDPIDLVERGVAAGEPGWAQLGRFADEYLDVLDAEGVLDYSELVHRVRILLTRPEISDAVRAEFGAVYVDEFAELDPAQVSLVRALLPDDGALVAFADLDTAIFRFRGAHPRVAAEFARLFNGETVVLGAQHRLPAAVGASVQRVAARLSAPGLDGATLTAYRGALAAGHSVARGSDALQVWTFPDEPAQARRIAAELRGAHLEGGLPWADMAVLVRSGRTQIPPLARALADAGVPVEVAGDEIGLADELAVRPLLLALELVARERPCDADEASRLLMSGWGGLDAVGLRVLGRALRVGAGEQARGRTSGDLIADALGGGPMPSLDEAPAVLDQVAARRAVLEEARGMVADGRRPAEVLWALWSGVPWPDELRAAALSASDVAPRANRDLDALVALFNLARSSSAKGGAAGLRAFLAEVAEQQIPADFERESAVRGRGVRVLTAHRAKGRSWPFVVVAGVQEGVWPDARRRGSIFDPQALTSDALGSGVTTRELVATERRLFLLSCTRASSRLLVTAVAGTEGEADQPSRFLAELGVPARHLVTAPAGLHTLRALVASLRRTAADPSASPELREAACVRLARLADETDAQGRPLVADADPERWWGLRRPTSLTAAPAGPITLSPSQLSAILACPRQYFLSREAKADPPRSSSAILGTVIHALAEHAASKQLTREQALTYLDDVWASIPFPAPWFSLSEKAAAEQAVLRFMGWQEAHDYADVVGLEVPFTCEVEVDGGVVRIKGAIDRLERTATGELRVVDFKSSRSKPTVAEAAASEQLGLYQLAIETGAFDAGQRAGGGQLVFLRHGDDDYPKVFEQPSLRERPSLGDDDAGYETWVHAKVAAARAVLVSGRFDATPGSSCQWCSFASSCPATSGQVIA